MKNKIKHITIKHSILGEILIHNGLKKEYNDLIGTETIIHKNNKPIYYADIFEEENYILILRLSNIIAETINIGFKRLEQGGAIGSIDLYCNRFVDEEIKVYPNALLTIDYIYEKSE
jgi:hypothetical protein